MCKENLSKTYYGSIFINLGSYLLPALYVTLSKLWVASIDRSMVATSDTYTYVQTVVKCLNDGLPRTAWNVIGDKSSRSLRSRLSLAYTMIVFQVGAGALLTLLIALMAPEFASVFVPKEERDVSLTYVRISSIGALASSMRVAVEACTRALDQPSVSFWTGTVKLTANIILDLLFLSHFHIGLIKPTVNAQAAIRVGCDLVAALFGFSYFLYGVFKLKRELTQTDVLVQPNADDTTENVEQTETREQAEMPKPSLGCLKVLARPAVYTFIESLVRNAIYLWLVSGIVAMGRDYATAWGVFMGTIRWGIPMIPTLALETSAVTFVGHKWGEFRANVGVEVEKPVATNEDLLKITKPALKSCLIAFVFELLMYIAMSFWGAKHFAYYLSQSEEVALLVQEMWKSIDWCYIFFATAFQLSAILLATHPRVFLWQSLSTNLLWMLPWAVVASQIHMSADMAWNYHSIIFGGVLIFNFGTTLFMCSVWAWMLKRGRLSVAPIRD